MFPVTKQAYAHYQQSVKDFFETNEVENMTTESEPYCSSHGCDVCGDSLQQMLYDAHAFHPKTNDILDFQVCEDCAYYIEYGRLNDEIMDQLDTD